MLFGLVNNLMILLAHVWELLNEKQESARRIAGLHLGVAVEQCTLPVCMSAAEQCRVMTAGTPGSGGCPGGGKGSPLQYSCLENPMDRGAWEATVHGVTESRTRLSDFTFLFPFHHVCSLQQSNAE